MGDCKPEYLSRLSLSGLEDLSSGVLYTTGMPGADGDSAKITRSPSVKIITVSKQQ